MVLEGNEGAKGAGPSCLWKRRGMRVVAESIVGCMLSTKALVQEKWEKKALMSASSHSLPPRLSACLEGVFFPARFVGKILCVCVCRIERGGR